MIHTSNNYDVPFENLCSFLLVKVFLMYIKQFSPFLFILVRSENVVEFFVYFPIAYAVLKFEFVRSVSS